MKKIFILGIVLIGIISLNTISIGPASALVAFDEEGKPIAYTPDIPDEPIKNGGPTSLQPGKVDSDKGNKGKPGPRKIIIELSEPGKK